MNLPDRIGGGVAGSQTLMRGLDVIEAVAAGSTTLSRLSAALGLTRSTTHRLAASLVERGYLAFVPRGGYRLGSKLLALGNMAQEQADIVQLARPHLEALAEISEDTVHLGIMDGDQALYLDKMPGRRRINISSRVGDRQPLTSTGLGKALMLDHDETYWRKRLQAERVGARPIDEGQWLARMRRYVASGSAYDMEENEDQIRCVAAPVRNYAGRIVGAISVSGAAQYMADDRMSSLSLDVVRTAEAISLELGWRVAGDEAASG